MEETRSLELVTDNELLRRLVEILRQSRRVEVDLVAHIGEVDARRLYAREAAPSMFAYCTGTLHLSEAEAYLRIAAARASREHPVLLTMLAGGRVHLTAIAKLAPHLTPENRDRLLERAAHRTKRQIEELVAELAPRQDVPALVRRLPERRPLPPATPLTLANPAPLDPCPGLLLGPDTPVDGELRPDAVEATRPRLLPAQGGPPATVEPLAPARYKVQFTASAELRDKLDRLRALMRPAVPDGDLAAIIEAAVTEKLERLEARRFARTKVPRKGPPATPGCPLPRATSRPRSGGPSTSATAAGAATSTSRVGDAPLAKDSSFITATRSHSAATTPPTGWLCCVGPTTACSPRSTSDERPWRSIGDRTPRRGGLQSSREASSPRELPVLCQGQFESHSPAPWREGKSPVKDQVAGTSRGSRTVSRRDRAPRAPPVP